MPTARERLRTRLRRKAAFLVETGSASRRAMSADEVEHFLWSIEKNDPNAFGLTKLSELRLNDPVDVAARGYSWNATADTGIEGRMTLLTYAAWLGRAWIVRGLLRAGAVPEVGSISKTETTKQRRRRSRAREYGCDEYDEYDAYDEYDEYDEYDVARTGSLALLFKRLHARYPEAATWLAIAATRARAAGGARLAENARLGARLDEDAPLSRCAFRACRAARPRRPFAFATCRHAACEMCVWEAVAREHGGGFCCPVCDDAKRRDEAEPKPTDVSPRKRKEAGDASRRASRARWLTLPAEAPDAACAASEAGVASTDTRDDEASASEPPGELPPSRRGKLLRLGKTRLADAVLGSFDAKGARTSFSPAPAPAAARRRASKHATREDRTRALLAAAASGDAPMVRAVVDAGVDVECADECGFTPLALAAWRGHARVADYLLRGGADPDARDDYGVAALHKAVGHGHMDVARRILADGGADVNVRVGAVAASVPKSYAAESRGQTALHVACRRKQGDEETDGAPTPADARLVATLLRYGADPNARDALGETPLHHALEACDAASARLLARAGADPNARDAAGRTPRDALELSSARAACNRGLLRDILRTKGAV